ncbi:rod shape-determining protein RodA [Patescibacteria group bacterium]|nr:MAG: rod shape-determining protein RodA [Patescibacteria group bacterium]
MIRDSLVKLRFFDWKLLAAVFLLIGMGLAAIYSVDLSRGSELVYFKKQVIAAGLGAIFLVAAGLTQSSFWRFAAKWLYLGSLLSLAAVLLFGSTIHGTRGWFSAFGFSFQPVEFAKIALILLLSYIIYKFGRKFERPLFFFGTGAVTLLMLGLVLLQPDLGSAFLLGLVWLGLVWLAGARRIFILLLLLTVILLGVGSWYLALKDYQKERLITFVDPGRDQLNAGYNITQSVIAVGAGKWYGRGLGFGSQSQLRFLPEAQTDFIFSVIGEELGFAGAAVMLALFAVVFWRLLVFIRSAKDDFAASASAGALVLFLTQFFTNVGANIGLVPITGVTLPFISYGGSSLAMNLALVGILQSLAQSTRAQVDKGADLS